MIKMLVTSFYHTLIDDEESIPTSTMLELDRIRNNNTKITILTNGLLEDVLYYNHDYPFIDYIISLNGGLLLDVNKNKKVYGKAFTKQEIKKIANSFANKEVFYYSENKKYKTIPSERVYKIAIKLSKKEAGIYKIKEYEQSIYIEEDNYYLELTKNTSWQMLKHLMNKKEINKEELLCIIQNDSEQEILDNISNTFILHNGLKSLKGKRSSKTNNNKGVETIIKKEIK